LSNLTVLILSPGTNTEPATRAGSVFVWLGD
jgi:hypothetical protein